MTNADLARILDQLAALSELNDDNPFRVRAYRNAARTVLDLEEQVPDLIARGADLTEIQGIGKEIAQKLRAITETGSLEQLEELKEAVPVGLIAVTEVQGVGPKRARTLWRELDVTGIDDLERVAKEGRVAELEGFGEKSQEKILKGIDSYRRHSGRMRLGDADALVQPLLMRLRGVAGVRRAEVAGSYRRRRETIGDVDLLVVADDGRAASEALTGMPGVAEVLGSGETRTSVRLEGGLQVDLRVVPEESFGAAWLYFTGSMEHNVELRQAAVDRGWHLSEYGLFEGGEPGRERSGGKRLAGASEEEVYDAFDLDWVPPELREHRGEIEAAGEHRLPELVTVEAIRGDLHMHSTWSDGKAGVLEMMEACEKRSYEYMAITDHSKALRMTGGLDAEKLGRQWQELDELTADRDGIAVLRGMEVDILRDGSLDLEEEWLAKLDIVIVSVHSLFDLAEAAQTERMVEAVSHPEVNVLAHPTGRLLGERDPYPVDLDAVFEACAGNGVAVELNASPERLDLNDVHALAARHKGLTLVIDTDAHSTRHLDFMHFGVEQARRAWVTPDAVLNTRPLADVKRFLGKTT
ncbi:MAG TPA: DNA polymerase/3'-5' exonuclease PolX [Trueperaceae bacterium]|nr:DNA polymerase/3'-5' exonuclease PolX [Trueperaceae bacterium]